MLVIFRILLHHDLDPNILLAPNPLIESTRFRSTPWGIVLIMILMDWQLINDFNVNFSDYERLTWQSCTAEIVEKFLNLGASPNTRIFVQLRAKMDSRCTIWLQVSPLTLVDFASMTTNHSHTAYNPAKIQESLRSAGALKHKDALYLSPSTHDPQPDSFMSHRLSKAQSEKVAEAIANAGLRIIPISWKGYFATDLDPSARGTLKEIMNSLSEDDAIDEETMRNEINSLPESF